MAAIPPIYDAQEAPPQLDRSLVEESKLDALIHLQEKIIELFALRMEFKRALLLYDFAHATTWEGEGPFGDRGTTLWTLSGWQMIAARDGAMSIFHFGTAVQLLPYSLSRCGDELVARADQNELRGAKEDFDRLFPGSKQIRDAIAHVAANSQSPSKINEHAVKGVFQDKVFASADPDNTTWLPGNLNDRQFAVTFERKAYSYHLSHQTLADLTAIRDRIGRAFVQIVR
jgi:hypothetical protein